MEKIRSCTWITYNIFIVSAIAPIFVYSLGIDEWNISEIVNPLFIIFASLVTVFLLLRGVLQSSIKAFTVTLYAGFLFFQFEPIEYIWVYYLTSLFEPPIINSFPGILFIVASLAAICLMVINRSSLAGLKKHSLLLIILITHSYLAVPLIDVIINEDIDKGSSDRPFSTVIPDITGRALPDIYYIVPDAYGSNTTFQNLYNFDNRNFTTFLKEKGFYVAKQSHSNYMQTKLSLPSTLNFEFISAGKKTSFLNKSLSINRLFYELEDIGYEKIIIPYRMVLKIESRILQATPVSAILKLFKKDGELVSYRPEHREVVEQSFQIIKREANNSSGKPKIVFAHLQVPHPPFVFDGEGKSVSSDLRFSYNDGSEYHNYMMKFKKHTKQESIERYRKDYIAQLQFTNKMLAEVIEQILYKPKRPVIIILQGDHGPRSLLEWSHPERADFEELHGILNAYYFYDKNYDDLYPTITPVNSFRIVLNQYFSTALPLLDDRIFISPFPDHFKFTEITDKLN